jgi:cytochrome c2
MNGKYFSSWMGWLLLLGMLCVFGLGCSQAEEEAHSSHSSVDAPTAHATVHADDGGLVVEVPQKFQSGEERFNAFCARCHGVHARGTTKGPPLVHKIYEPSHHGDFAFLRAAAQGVRAHHWDFGNMPKIGDASPDDVKLVIGYVRWLQREAGIH